MLFKHAVSTLDNGLLQYILYTQGVEGSESLLSHLLFISLQEKVDVRVARIFNTFGPRMYMNDGRVVSNFILQCLQRKPITVSITVYISSTLIRHYHNVINIYKVQPPCSRLLITQCYVFDQIYGDGTQTRSFQYVTDLVDGLISLMDHNYTLPVNLGNPEEHTINDFANIIRSLSGKLLF